MDIVVTKVYPVAYIEFLEDKDGKKRGSAPMGAREEYANAEKWKTQREAEAEKLRVEFEGRFRKMNGWAERLERKAGAFKPRQGVSFYNFE
jgi:breast cancer 2 susceptibility protein